MDKAALEMMLKYAGLALLALLLVFAIAVVTPRLSAWVEKRFPKKEKSPAAVVAPEDYTVKGPYDTQLPKKKEDDSDGKK